MKKLFWTSFFILISGLLGIFSADNSAQIKLYVLGDSTAANYSKYELPKAGWAQILQEFFDSKKIIIVNRAVSGRSSKSFFDEKQWDNIYRILKPGDFVFIQFGHNDEKKDDPYRYTDPATTYKEYLKIYINQSREKGAIPVLFTPIHRNSWADGKIKDTHKEYSDAVRVLAIETDVPLIDLADKTKKLFEDMGQDKMNKIFMIFKPGEHPKLPNGIRDNTHLQENGAREISRLAVEGIIELKLSIVSCLKKKWQNK